ncbi:unnamed protein product [Thlaspi arvense]|uniref:Aldose 1-epimerase n=1 Tax=Thlaspi arvense TaxID=13288 RepID=A0AAU9RKR3_THLAR|nr:unnamed protein product [Thlaspi arvense]
MSGFKGLTKVIYKVKSYKQDSHITFTYHSVDGEEGFPGDLQVSVTYSLPEPNKLEVKMKAKALNKPTPVSLGTHFYWNLGGHNSGDILSHSLQLFASRFTPLDIELIPTGEISPVQGTVYDFLQPHIIGSKMKELKGGYDMNYVVDNAGDGRLAKVAVVQESKSGRKMELWSTAPGVQFYTSNVMGGVKGKEGLCLEPQGFPNSVNQPNFPSQIVNPGDIYKHVMVFEFTANSN